MSTRSATNKRTQSHEVTWVARKSAASAKPARQAASSVRVVPASSKARRKELEKGENLEGLSKEEKRARKAKQRAKEDRIYTVSNILLKQDEDYTKRRRIWWIVLAIGMVLVVAIWASLYFFLESFWSSSAAARSIRALSLFSDMPSACARYMLRKGRIRAKS